VLRIGYNAYDHELLRMIVVKPDPLANRIRVGEVLVRQSLVDNTH